jgi:type I restriction enzyme S subunit
MNGQHRRLARGEICEFINGHGFGPAEWSAKGLPIIRIQNLNGSKDFNHFNGKPEPSWLITPGTILFAWAGVKGVSFGPAIWDGPMGVLNQHIYRVEPKLDVNSYWLFVTLRWITSRIEARAHGFKTSLVHVHKIDITRQVIDVPSLDEQRRIVDILATWDRAVDTSSRLVSIKERMLIGLVRRAFSGRSAGSVIRRFGDLLSESRIEGTHGEAAQKLTVKLYGLGVIPKVDKRKGSRGTVYYKRRVGQFIYSKLDFLNGAFGIIPQDLDGYETTQDLPSFDISADINPNWLLEYLRRPEYYRFQTGLARGQRKARRVNPPDLLRSTLNVPPRVVQDRVVEEISTFRRGWELEQQKTAALRRQRDALASELLTGRLRVREAERLAIAAG